MLTTTKVDPIISELTATLPEWHHIWISLYLDNNTELFERIGNLILELIDAREELISLLGRQCTDNNNSIQINNCPQIVVSKSEAINIGQQINELKEHIVTKIDVGNQSLGLDLVLRDLDFRPVDPIEISPVRLYQLHAEKTNSDLMNNAAYQQPNQDSNSATGSVFCSTVSQTGSDITTFSHFATGHSRHHQSNSYHLQLSLKHHSVSLVPQDEKLEFYLSVAEVIPPQGSSPAQLNPISEKFLIQVKDDNIVDGYSKTVFANIGQLKGRELGIVVQAYRVGRMILSEASRTTTFGKQQSGSNILEGSLTSINNVSHKYNSNGLSRSRHSTIGGLFTAPSSYKRPFGSSFIPLAFNTGVKHSPFKEFFVNTRLIQVQNESEFSQLGDIINPTKQKAPGFRSNSVQPSVQLELAVRVLLCKQESIPRISSFNLDEYCTTEKRGFPDIVMPGDFKNDLYLNLEGAEFEKGGKSISKNIEASISLIDRSGLVIENCIVPASNCDKVSSYKSCIFYHSNSPRWNEHLKINVPLTEFDKAHIRIEFRHCSTKDREKKFLGFSFLPLSDDDGTVIPDKNHELYLYKCDSQIWEDDSLNLNMYSSLPYGPGAFMNETNSTIGAFNSGSSNTLRASQSGKFTHSNREIVTVSTFLLSTKLTQNSTLLNLLRWRELIKRNNKDFEDTLNKVLTLKGEEIVKFLQDILDTLFDTFTLSLSNEDGCSSLIFKVLVHIFLLLDEPKYQHFKPVLDTYASAHFSATLVYKGLLACVMACVKRGLECVLITEWQAPIQKCFKTIKYVFLFIVQSKLLYSQATCDQSIDEHFLMDLRQLFLLFETMLSNMDKKLMPLQETFLESFPGALEQLVRVMDPLELAKFVTSLAGSVGFHLPPSLSKSKLIFMREVASSSLIKKQDARVQISEIFCRHLDIYLNNFERLELCHEVLEALLIRIHDSHWPSIHRSYQLMLRGQPSNFEPCKETATLATSSVMTVGEINLYSRVNPIQANQLDLTIMEVSRELEPFVKLMESLLNLLDRLVRDLNSDRPIIQRYCNCLLTILKLMSKTSFELFLTRRQINYSNLCDLFKSLRAVYNRDWSIMQLTSHAILEHPIDELSRDERMEIRNQNPSSYINLIVDFITHPTLQLESFSERKRQYILKVFGDLRLKFTDQLIRFWNGLSKMNYCELIATSMQAFLDACLLPNDELQQRLLLVFYDMIDAEDSNRGSFRQIERCMIDNLDLFLNLDRGDVKFIENFDRILRAKMREKSPTWEQKGQRLIGSFTKLMQLLIDYRQSLETYDNRSKQMICLVELLSFYKDLERMDIYLKYLFKLSDIHIESSHFTEAGFTLKLYADELRWCNRNLTALDGFRPDEQEWRRKEVLYQLIIQYFDWGKCWEESIGLCKELASFYENFLVDYEKLSSILKRLTQLLDSILTEHRPEREYFRVEYLGSELPDYIRGKEFVYRGGEYERLAAFVQRATLEFPDAKVLNSKSAKSLGKDCSGQYLVISNVKPVPFLQDTFKTGQRNVNDKVIQYYLNNRLDTFSYDMPIVKRASSTNADTLLIGEQANNVRNLWVARCMLKIRKQLPDILPWSEVISQEHIEISPITNAIETISGMNLELSKLILCYSKEPGKPLSPLTMRLQGVLEASVNGGPAVIMNAFFKRPDIGGGADQVASRPSGNKDNKIDHESLLKLRNLIKQQFTLLESGLSLHSRLAPPEVMPLHARLVERLDVLRRTFSDEASQAFEDNYETLQPVQPVQQTAGAGGRHATPTSEQQQQKAAGSLETDIVSGVSSRPASSTDEVDGVSSGSTATLGHDLNGNIYGDLDEQQATYARPSEQPPARPQQNRAHHQHHNHNHHHQHHHHHHHQARVAAPNGGCSAAAKGDALSSPSSAARNYTMSSSSLSTLAILSNLPALSRSASSNLTARQQRILLTPTKELGALSLQQNGGGGGADSASRAARRLTFDSHKTSVELTSASLSTSDGASNSGCGPVPCQAPPPLPPRLFGQQAQAARSAPPRSPSVPPRLASPQQQAAAKLVRPTTTDCDGE